MEAQALLKTVFHGLFVVLFWVQQPYAEIVKPVPPPGTYERSAIGNSFGTSGTNTNVGAGGYGYGKWVQNYVGAMAVSADGTVFNETGWD
jgi:hypothetical protein